MLKSENAFTLVCIILTFVNKPFEKLLDAVILKNTTLSLIWKQLIWITNKNVTHIGL